jgi:DNA-binding transcriptional LysR family regulator
LDLRHLRYFTAVAEELHFGRAARRLKVSQPPLSRQISDLERELGVKLLNRTSHRVELTPAGRAFLAESREIAAAFERAKATVRGVGTQPSGLLRIGYQSIGWPLQSAILRNVVARYPAIVPALEPMSSAEQMRAIRDRQLDIGVVWQARDGGKGDSMFERLVLTDAPAVLALAGSHPWAARRRIPVEHLANQTLIMSPRRENPEIHDHLIGSLQRYRVVPNILYRNGSGIIDMVAAGIGVAFITSTVPFAARPDIVVRPFNKPVLMVRLALIWLRGNQLPSLKGFLAVVTALKERGQTS